MQGIYNTTTGNTTGYMDDVVANPYEAYVADYSKKLQTMSTTTMLDTYACKIPILETFTSSNLKLLLKVHDPNYKWNKNKPTIIPPPKAIENYKLDAAGCSPMHTDSGHHKQCGKLRMLCDGNLPGLAKTIKMLFPNDILRACDQDRPTTWPRDRCTCFFLASVTGHRWQRRWTRLD